MKFKNPVLYSIIILLVLSNLVLSYFLFTQKDQKTKVDGSPSLVSGAQSNSYDSKIEGAVDNQKSNSQRKKEVSQLESKGINFITTEKIDFKTGETYPLCGRYGDVPLYDSIEGEISGHLVFCFYTKASLGGTNIFYGRILILDEEWMLVHFREGRDANDTLVPARAAYVKLKDLTTPFVLSDGFKTIPLKYAGLDKVIINPDGYEEFGEKDPCYGSIQPRLFFSSGARNLTSDDAFFDVDKLQLLQNTSIEITKHCGT